MDVLRPVLLRFSVLRIMIIDIIMKHEKTRKEKEDDRTNHIITTGAQTGPVFLTYKDVDEINIVVDKVTSD
jgi:uncharacterized protein (DUF1015 family)